MFTQARSLDKGVVCTTLQNEQMAAIKNDLHQFRGQNRIHQDTYCGKRASREALELLAEQPWPGNVRELRNTILRAVGTETGPLIRRDSLFHGGPPASSVPENESLDVWEKQHIAHVLTCHGGNVREAAKALGVGRSTLYKKLAAHGLSY
jgi:DNA-binding NtrC family response regulator